MLHRLPDTPRIEHAKLGEPRAILFVGNSYTNRNDLPGMLERLAAAGNPPWSVETERVIANGMSLKTHWDRGVATKLIRSRKWDYVVLQDQSTMALKNPARLKEYVAKFEQECRAHGAKAAVYLTWARKGAPERQREITAAYEAAARDTSAVVVPVGVAWQRVIEQEPTLALHVADQSHPTLAGSYLAACVFYSTLLGRSPIGLPALGVPTSDALVLQATAWAVCEDRVHPNRHQITTGKAGH